MEMNALIARINFLAKKKRESGLNETELTEQKTLYKEYLGIIRGQVINHLENIEVVDTPSLKH